MQDTSIFLGFLGAQMVKNPSATWETWVQSWDWEDPQEQGMATHSSIFAWRTPLPVQRNLLGYMPWRSKESDGTEQLNTAQHISGISSVTT